MHGLERVHAILRRLDDDFCDPLELRSDSTLGVPGRGSTAIGPAGDHLICVFRAVRLQPPSRRVT